MADLSQYDPAINAAAAEWGHDPDMLRALIQQESGGNSGAISGAGARGLTQIIPKTAAGLGMTDPTDPTQQIFGAAKYLAEGRDKEGSPEGALLYYHGGPNWRQAYGRESQGYVPGVAAKYTALKGKATAGAADAVPSDAEFLKSLAAPATAPDAASAVPSDTDFLKSTGATPGAPPPPPTPAIADAAQNEYGITGDPQQFNKPGVEVAQPVANVLSAAGQGAKAGFGGEPLGLSAASEQALVKAGVYNGPDEYNPLKGINRALIGGAAAGGDLLLRGGNALVGAYQRGVSQAGEEVGAPQLGRDLAALPEAFPTGDTGGGLRLPEAKGGPAINQNRLAISQAAHDRLDAPLPAQFLDAPFAQGFPGKPAEPALPAPASPNPNLLAASAIPSMTVRPGGAAPSPQSAGAAASPSNAVDMSPREVQAYRSTAEGQKLLEPQQPGQADATAYVPGVSASTAEIEQTVNAAREAKAANVAHPEVSQASREIAAANNETRQQYQQNTFRSPVDINNAIDARAAQAETDLAATWQNKKPADAQPVIDAANEIKASPDGRRPVVRNALDAVTKELYDGDGKLITDPEQLYGVRKHIDDLLSKEAGATDPKSIRAAANLQQIKAALDAVIEPAAPGFQQYLKNFSDASRPIDEMRVLQGHESKLYDTQGRMQLSRVQSMMRNIVDSRAAPGLNPYKSISDDTMQRLWNLRDDLRRSASAQELARTPGSDTTQTMFDLAKRSVAVGGRLAAHGVANHLFPVLGSLGVNAAEAAMGNRMAARAQRRGVAAGMGNLNPNRLIQPQD